MKKPLGIHNPPDNLVRVLVGVLMSVLSALLVILAMPPYGIWPLALIAFIPMVIAQYRILPKKLSALSSAITITGIVALYVTKAFLELSHTPLYMKLLPLLFGAVLFLCGSNTRTFHERTGFRWFVLANSFIWGGIEMIRSLLPMMGTWGFVAYVYFKSPWIIQPVSIFGIFGLSLLTNIIAFSLGFFSLSVFDKYCQTDKDTVKVSTHSCKKWVIISAGLFAAWTCLSIFQYLSPANTKTTVAAIQPGYKNFWTDEEIKNQRLTQNRYFEVYKEMFQSMVSQTREAAANGATIVVWPEGALNFNPQLSHTDELTALAMETQTYLVLAYASPGVNETTILAPDGTFLGTYGKNHPVSFMGERSQSGGTYQSYNIGKIDLGTIICYDLDFTDTARKVARNGADIIAVPSGDWPGIADKHFAHLVFRAVENRTAMIKSDRSYDSVIIDPYGRIIEKIISKDSVQATLIADVETVTRIPIQVFLGDWVGWLSLVGLILFTLAEIFVVGKPKLYPL